MSEGFVYCWTDHKNNKLYVGVHKGTVDDGYICSSKDMLIEHQLRQADFTRQIIANGDYEDMRALETAILRSANVRYDDGFYNKTVNTGSSHTVEVRQKISKAHKGKVFSDLHRQRLSENAKTRVFSAETKAKIGIASKKMIRTDKHKENQSKSWTTERKLKHSLRIKQIWQERSLEEKHIALSGFIKETLSEEHKKKISLSHIGKKHSQETKNKISQTRLERKYNGS